MSSQVHQAQIRITADARGWRVVVGDGSTRPVEGWIPDVTPFPAAPAPASSARVRVLVAGSDAASSAAEHAVAAELARVWSGSGPAWDHLQVLRGRAEAAGAPLVLVIDAPDLPGVPWELASLGVGAHEAATGGLVARWAHGTPSVPEPTATAAVWVGGADDVTASVEEAVRRSFTRAGLREVGLDAAPSVVWVIAHGTRDGDLLQIAIDGPRAGSATAVQAHLGDALRTATIAVLAVCHAGADDLDGSGALVGRLLEAGVPVVVATPRAAPAELLRRLADGMADAVARGEALHAVVSSGRRAVRGWAFPHPLARWTQVQCHVSAASALSGVLRPAGWSPAGWPRPDAGAGAWLAAAHRDAVRRADGYVGVEHLVRALATLDGGGPLAALVRRSASRWLAPFDEVGAALLPQRPDDRPYGATPRVAAFGARLGEPFGIEALAEQVVAAMAAPTPPTSGETLASAPSDAVPATGLEVVGGPEDGRAFGGHGRFTIGRAGGDADVALYDGTRLTDRGLSRRHLVWDAGVLEGRGVEVTGPDGASRVGPVRAGDVVRVSAGTRLRGVARIGDRPPNA